jgi:hypothetical protein
LTACIETDGVLRPATRERRSESVVYFIQSEKTPTIKRGISIHPEKRLADLQSANGARLRLIGTTTEHSERDLHTRFKASRMSGEWFRSDDVLLEFLWHATYGKSAQKQALRRRASFC